MKGVTNGPYFGKASFHFLPIIDLNPTNFSCIYSTLIYVNDLSIKMNVKPVLTFDQPLWFKARHVVSKTAELSRIILIHGEFHTEMSFLGVIGSIMKSSGLSDILEMVYAQNTITHMLNGKAYECAVRGYHLIDRALNSWVLEKAIMIKWVEAEHAVIEAHKQFDTVIKAQNESLVDPASLKNLEIGTSDLEI